MKKILLFFSSIISIYCGKENTDLPNKDSSRETPSIKNLNDLLMQKATKTNNPDYQKKLVSAINKFLKSTIIN